MEYKYKYNGKEWQDELGLNMYDMDMRQYDPAIARWVVQDPVVHFHYSPYSAFDNNPVVYADPSGADSESMKIQDFDGNWHTIGSDQYTTIFTASEEDSDKGDDNGDPKKKKSTYQLMGEGYASGYSITGGGYHAGMNGRDPHNPTAEDEATADNNFGNTILTFIPFGKAFQGLGWAYKAYRASRVAKGLASLQFASKYGINPYSALVTTLKGKGLQAHHLLEQRFASTLGLKSGSMDAIAVTAAEHQVFTNAWRAKIGYDGSKATITTATATKEQIYSAAKEIYKNYPEILNALGL